MAFQPVPDTASFKIVMRSNTSAVEINNTWYVRDFGVFGWGTEASLTAVAVALGNAWRDQVMPNLSSDAVFDRVEARDESTEFGLQTTSEYNTLGGVVGNPLSAMICMLVQIRTAPGNPPRGGRFFISPFSESQVARDLWDATLLSTVQTAIQACDDAIGLVNPSLSVVRVSRYSKSAVPLAPHKRATAETGVVATYETRDLIATQRDRRTGIGA